VSRVKTVRPRNPRELLCIKCFVYRLEDSVCTVSEYSDMPRNNRPMRKRMKALSSKLPV